MLRYAVLAMLNRQADHGYRLFRRFETASGGAWRLNGGSIYHSLKQLIERGEIRTDTRPGQHKFVGIDHATEPGTTYCITQAGETNLGSWLRQPLRRPEAFRSEIAVRLMTALQLDAGLALAQIDAALERYAEHFDALEANRRNVPVPERDNLCRELLLDGAIRETHSHLAWLAYCRSRLASYVTAHGTRGKERSDAA